MSAVMIVLAKITTLTNIGESYEHSRDRTGKLELSLCVLCVLQELRTFEQGEVKKREDESQVMSIISDLSHSLVTP